MKRTGFLRKAAVIFFWLALWQFISIAIHNSIILVGPAQVAGALFNQLPRPDFWKATALSFGKILCGFFMATAAGCAAGCAAVRFPFIKDLLEPVMVLIKSVPVASFVILALFWVGSRNLSIFISFLVVFPMIYVNTIAGLKNARHKLLEMAAVFRMTALKKLRYIYWPALLPFLTSGIGLSFGMSVKSGIAAEVIGVPAHSIGERLYMAKIFLSTADLFAWTLVIILISGLFEKALMKLLKAAERKNYGKGTAAAAEAEGAGIRGKRRLDTWK